jgi:hypothetical protein
MPTLRELEAEFIRYDGETASFRKTESIQDAQGILFLCPQCFLKNNGGPGTHSVLISFSDRGVTDAQGSHNKEGKPTRWGIQGGSGLDDLQLSPSIHLEDTCGWHGHIGHSGIPAGSAA